MSPDPDKLFEQLIALKNIKAGKTTFGEIIKKRAQTECWECAHKREVPGNCHIECVRPDPQMIGNPHGIKNGWFMYPLLFDPMWKEKPCSNFEAQNNVNLAGNSSNQSHK